ncbi:MAG: InlB B-repeat-containing protein, partial [Erysipelotrichaceae bacterium]|nr:InlB B-repeat-containing protein [Erysipelotrichaceae bacterium]
SDRENGEYFDSSTLDGDTVLYAVYKPAYTVRYFADGELVHTRYNLYSWDYSDWTDVPEKEGYAFGYWSDKEGGEEFYGDLEENMDLYAVYLPTYTVNYFVDGELYVTKTDVTEYTYSSFRNVPKKAGKVFSYWSETENGMQYYGEIKNNLNLHAVYQDSFTVKYYVNGELYAKRSDRTQENYQWVGVQEPDHKAFLYWSESENGPRFSGQLYDNIELHAVLADAYAVNYYDENGKLWQRDTHVLPDNFLERSGPTSKNGAFSHWSLTKGGEPYTGEISENMDLFAVYVPFVTVEFYNEDGTELLHTRTDAYGYDWRWNKAPKYIDGKKFMYWSKTIGGSEFWGEITEDTTFYAVYLQMYTVHYYVDGREYGTWDEATQYDWYYPNTPQKDGYRFMYWTDNPENETHFDGNGIKDGLKLYAVFKKTYTVNYWIDEDTPYATWDQATEDDWYYYPLPQKDGYRFAWWSLTPDGEYYDGSDMYDDMDLYAVFRKAYTINYWIDEDTPYATWDKATEWDWHYWPEPEKPGYVFVWWSLTPNGEYYDGSDMYEGMDLYARFDVPFTVNFWLDDQIAYTLYNAHRHNYWWHDVPRQLEDGRVFSHFELADGRSWPIDFDGELQEVYDVYAVYTQAYTVNYFVDGNLVYSRNDATEHNFYWEAPTKEGYRFEYWGDAEGNYVNSIYGDTDLYAYYVKAYTVEYYDGDTYLYTRTDACSWDYGWDGVEKYKDDLIFSYWSDTEDGNEPFNGEDLYNGIRLYAIYSEPLTLNYYIDGVHYTTRTDASMSDWQLDDIEYREGYLFYGWQNEDGYWVSNEDITNGMNLYGFYCKTYTITYYDSDRETMIGQRNDATRFDPYWHDWTYEGNDIIYWVDEEGNRFNGENMSEGMSVYAVYRNSYYTIYYYDSEYGDEIGVRTDATSEDFRWREQYYDGKRIGYWVDGNGNTVTGDMLYNGISLYTVYVYTVHYYDDDHTTLIGTRNDVTVYDYYWNGDMPVKEGYVFTYWEDEYGDIVHFDTLSLFDGMRVYAHYEEAFTIYYYVDGVLFGVREDATINSYWWKGDYPYKEGYIFTGWKTESGEYLNSSNLVDGMRVDAVFEEAITIHYYDMDHTTLLGTRTDATIDDYYYNDYPSHSGYLFDHWEDENGVQLSSETVYNDMNAYAVYYEAYYIRFYVDGYFYTWEYVRPDDFNVIDGPYKDGKAFIGWFTEDDRELTPEILEDNLNVYARYADAYHVTYIVYGVEVENRYDAHDYDFDGEYIRNNHLEDAFEYWSLDPDGDPFTGPVTEDITLYAVMKQTYDVYWGVIIKAYEDDFIPDDILRTNHSGTYFTSGVNGYGHFRYEKRSLPGDVVHSITVDQIPDGYVFLGFYRMSMNDIWTEFTEDKLVTTEVDLDITPEEESEQYVYFAVFEKDAMTFYYSHPASYVGYVNKVDSTDVDYGNYYACCCTSEDYLELTAYAYSSYEFRGWYLCNEYTEHPEVDGTLLTDGETFVFTAYDERLPGKYVLAYFERIVPFVEQINIPERLDLQVGEYETVTATVSPEGAPDGFSWTSSDESIVTTYDVGTHLGRINAISTGVATVTVTATDGSNVSATITVYVHNYEFVGFRFNSDDTADAVFMDYMDGTEGSEPAELSVGITTRSCT